MKKNVLIFLLVITSSINAQLKVFDSSAINLNDSFLELNQVITVTSFGGNTTIANNILDKLNKYSENYIIGKSILLYNLEGRNKALNFIDSCNISDEYKNYYKSFVSIVTGNIDDYAFYKNFLIDNLLILKLSIRKVIKGQIKRSNKEIVINKAYDYLKSKKLNVIDKVFIGLFVVEYKDWEDEFNKYKLISKLVKEFPRKFNQKKLLEYVKSCKYSFCNEFKSLFAKKNNELEQISNVLSNINISSEKKIKRIIKKAKGDKLVLKAYAFLYSEKDKLPQDLKFMLGLNTTYSFSNSFVDFLKKDINRKQIINYIEKDSEFLKEIGFDKKLNIIGKAKDEEILGALGMIVHLKKFKSNAKKNYFNINYAYSAGYNDFKSWDAYLIYLKNNPLHNEEKIIGTKKKEEYNKVLKALSSFNLNNPFQKQLVLATLLGNEEVFQLNVNSAEIILTTLIEMFALSQEMGENEPRHYTFRNNKISDAMSDFADESFIEVLLSHLTEVKKQQIIKNLVTKISKNPNNLGIKNLYLQILVGIRDYDKYVNLYLGNINSYGKLNFESEVENNMDVAKNRKIMIALLKGAYKEAKSKENLLYIIPLLKKFGLEDEANDLKKVMRDRREKSRY